MYVLFPAVAVQVPLVSGENWRHPAFAGPAEWVAARESLVQRRVWRVIAFQENPLDIDELAALPHSDADLPFKVELVLRRHRQAIERFQRSLQELSHQRDYQNPHRRRVEMMRSGCSNLLALTASSAVRICCLSARKS